MNVFLEKCCEYDVDLIQSLLLKYDDELFNKNIHKGDTVVIKPNWLAQSHKYNPNEWKSVITHPAVITAVLKIVLKKLDGDGKIIISDGPQTDSRWHKIMQRMWPDTWKELGTNSGIEVILLDLRDDEWTVKDGVVIERRKLVGDPKGSIECDLGNRSEFFGHQSSKLGYYGADYNKLETNEAHGNGSHRYRISKSIISADVFINVPKLKTHKKAGITCSLKNLVGINTYKNFLPHHNEGTPAEGGDQFPNTSLKNKTELSLNNKLKSLLLKYPDFREKLIPIKKIGKRLFGDTQKTIRNGNWYGNDTMWRMVLDLNKILFYSDIQGKLGESVPSNTKRYISIVDGIIGGEGNGPEAPSAKRTNVLIAGTNPVAVDVLCAKIMGFDWLKIPALKNAFHIREYPLCNFQYEDIAVISSDLRFNRKITDISINDCYRFKPHFGWVGHIEVIP